LNLIPLPLLLVGEGVKIYSWHGFKSPLRLERGFRGEVSLVKPFEPHPLPLLLVGEGVKIYSWHGFKSPLRLERGFRGEVKSYGNS